MIKKLDFERFKEIESAVNNRVMINKIPKVISKKKREELIAKEFLINDEDGELIISGGGRIQLFFLIKEGFGKHLMDIMNRKAFNQYEELIYFMRKIHFLKFDYSEFDADKVISDEQEEVSD